MAGQDELGDTAVQTEMKLIRSHHCTFATGIVRTLEFERKKLASYGVDVGAKCGHGCVYCGNSPHAFDHAIVAPDTPEKVARDAMRITQRGIVQLCTHSDAWAPEAQEYQLGRRCLEAILAQPDWIVRILTKNEAVRDDFDFIENHRRRVLVGLSLMAPPDRSDVMQILETDASPIRERMLAMVEAAVRGVRTYAWLGPLLPGIADSHEAINRLIEFAVNCRAEEIFVEPVSPHGPGLRRCQEVLERNGCRSEVDAIGRIRERANWSKYVVELLARTQQAMRKHSDISRLRFLLCHSGLLQEDEARIRKDEAGVVWVG